MNNNKKNVSDINVPVQSGINVPAGTNVAVVKFVLCKKWVHLYPLQ